MNVMILIGVGSLTTVITGQVFDKFGNKLTVIFNLLILTITTLCLFIFLESKQYNYQTFMLVFFWGMLDSSLCTHCYALIGSEFDNSTVAYAIFNLF